MYEVRDLTKNTCCFIGHRKISETEDLKIRLWNLIEDLILNQNVCTFLFGSKSGFNSLCEDVLIKAKEKYPHIKRVYVRAEFPHIDEQYKKYLLQFCDDTYFPEKLINAQRSSYIKRNYEMIDKSDFCVFYFNEQHAPTTRKSGTKVALDYAIKKNKIIYNLADK
ncbi:MAG: DUF1273 domain-containing protein [Clostridiales bacterium]|nr:DUF1273 domain-containing protein [Clostridiales bacterium]